MKKIFAILVLMIFTIAGNLAFGEENLQENIAIVKSAISSYKAENYLNCINILTEYTKTHKYSAVAYYYLGCAYMRIGIADKAKESFARTYDINTVPQLTSYAYQAVDCMNRGTNEPCVYYVFSKKQIAELQQDPANYLANVRNNILAEDIREGSDPEIEKLIHGEYSGRIHPEAMKVLFDERMKQKQFDLNKRTMLPVSNKIARAIRASYPVPSFAPGAKSDSAEVTADEMDLIIMSETAALNKQ